MLALRKNFGAVLEPSCGDGAFSNRLTNCTAIELDSTKAPANARVMDFFDFPASKKFDTIIGNPPYVRYQDIGTSTKRKLDLKLFDERSNLYLFFIEKCVRHLKPNGELIFITPRDFLKATSSRKLNALLYKLGTITDFIDLGDARIFAGFSPNCAIWRFELGNFSRRTNVSKNFICANGQLMFTDKEYPVRFSDVFFVKVGAVSGCDEVFTSDEFGNREFVCSETYRTGETRRMIFDTKHSSLEPHQQRLLGRRIKMFDASNWWQWGRRHFVSGATRIYVNCKTRDGKPFFLHECNDYDGSVLAVFPREESADVHELCRLLNEVDWRELGFICDGRFLFSQKSLEQCMLPDFFLPHVVAPYQYAFANEGT
ncbi:MAG: class I SAM-dependent methyltransferase [Rhizobacter sp.]|nr:class I SAM-dependent methyltransferase [Chlorobiales bacterium]